MTLQLTEAEAAVMRSLLAAKRLAARGGLPEPPTFRRERAYFDTDDECLDYINSYDREADIHAHKSTIVWIGALEKCLRAAGVPIDDTDDLLRVSERTHKAIADLDLHDLDARASAQDADALLRGS